MSLCRGRASSAGFGLRDAGGRALPLTALMLPRYGAVRGTPQEGFLGKQWTGSPEELTRLYGACVSGPAGRERLDGRSRAECFHDVNTFAGDQSAGDDRWRWHRFVKLWAQSQLQVANWADKHLPDGHYFRLRIEDLTSRRNTVEQKVRSRGWRPPQCLETPYVLFAELVCDLKSRASVRGRWRLCGG